MAVLSSVEKEAVRRKLVDRIYGSGSVLAVRSGSDLGAIVDRIDSAMEATTNAAAGAYSGSTLEAAFLQHVRVTVADASAEEVGLALAFWSMKRVGLI